MTSRSTRKSTDEVRPVHVVLNVLGHCHSSACVEIGQTRVICAVRPPQQLSTEYRGTRGRVSCLVHRSLSGGAAITTGESDEGNDGTGDWDMALALEGVAEQMMRLETIPQILMETAIEVLQDDGALWDAASTALSCALAAGGMEMYDTVSACSAALMPDGAMIVDPDKAETEASTVRVTVCSSLTGGSASYVEHHGVCEVTTLQELLQRATDGIQARKASLLSQLRSP